MLLKRAGRGYATGGINTTSPGELAVDCPACPQPGKNLPEKWESSDPSLLYVKIPCPASYLTDNSQVFIHTLFGRRRKL
jgi:hypothetical protein